MMRRSLTASKRRNGCRLEAANCRASPDLCARGRLAARAENRHCIRIGVRNKGGGKAQKADAGTRWRDEKGRPRPGDERPRKGAQLTTDPNDELVVCIHGLGRSRHCWWPMRRWLGRAGFRTEAWTYPSFGRSVEELGRDCLARLGAWQADPAIRTIHLVTHSLGGIVVRWALQSDPACLGKLGWVVMLAPPNRGSVWACRLSPWLGRLAPVLPQLSNAPESFVNSLPPVPPGVQVAVIAAARDGKCPVATTHVRGEAAHIVVPGRHTFIMWRRDVGQAVIDLLGGRQDTGEEFNKC